MPTASTASAPPDSDQSERARLVYSHHQGKYFAHWLSLRSRDEVAVTQALAASRVDMNPHQVDAALFALQSPLQAGVLLADEVGLGKTIEAGLVIAQCWAQQRRRILLVVPATLRKQWREELHEKFQLPAEILEARSYAEARRAGRANPFERDGTLVITSYEFAASKAADVAAIGWDLAVLDEAHKLRNLYKGEAVAKRAWALNAALHGRRKVLLTATPFQNSLMELYGLLSFISDDLFGSREAFQWQYAAGRPDEARLRELRHRLAPICRRTLRRQVQAEGGINFTRRFSITQDFTPSDEELELYRNVSAYLQDESILAIKPAARHLVTLVVRKILASSSFAIADTLETIIARLQARQTAQATALPDYETAEELTDELGSDESDGPVQADLLARDEEIARLRSYRDLARGIQMNRKGEALLDVLERAFTLAEKLGGRRKAVIFTESRRTQAYLQTLLEANGYAGRTVLLNGSNADADSKAVYAHWQERHAHTAAVSGSRTADMKAAIVEAFRDERDILISTEAGGEGINLQFCSLLVNYDLPWNPQRVEQRIGRIHRYGQQHDVVVVNFVNRKNRADELVFELLAKKFKLFDGVFGASDEILGAIESGVEIEQRINRIYQQCRTQAQIEAEFADLQQELDESITLREQQTRNVLLEHFDEDVVQRLRSRRQAMEVALSLQEKQLQRLIAAERPHARFADELVELDEGRYALRWPPAEQANVALLRPDRDLGLVLCESARARPTPAGLLRLRYGWLGAQFADVKSLVGSTGRLRVALVTIETAAEHLQELVCAASREGREPLEPETAARLLQVPGSFEVARAVAEEAMLPAFEDGVARVLTAARHRNERWFQQETERLDRWAEDQRLTLRHTVDELDTGIRDARRLLRQLETLAEKATQKREIKMLEQRRDDAMLAFYERRKEIAAREEAMLDRIEEMLAMWHSVEVLFDVEWALDP